MRTMSWLSDVEALGTVMEGEEGALMFAAVLGLKRWGRHCLNSCLSQSPCRHSGTGRIPPV